MQSERDYFRQSSTPNFFSGYNVLYVLIGLNVLIFLLIPMGTQLWLYDLALSSHGIQRLKLWQFATYMFLHAGFSHILFNMWGLYLFGSLILPVLGQTRFLILYFLSGISGALLWLSLNWNSNVPIVGASGAVFGVMMGAAMLFPGMRIQLLFPPIPMQMKTFVMVYAIIEIASEISNSQAGIAHLAHLGGFFSAYLYLRTVYRDRVWDMFAAVRTFFKRAPTSTRQSGKTLPKGWQVYTNPPASQPVSQDEVDRILDKISASGLQSLTSEELQTLKRVSDKAKES